MSQGFDDFFSSDFEDIDGSSEEDTSGWDSFDSTNNPFNEENPDEWGSFDSTDNPFDEDVSQQNLDNSADFNSSSDDMNNLSQSESNVDASSPRSFNFKYKTVGVFIAVVLVVIVVLITAIDNRPRVSYNNQVQQQNQALDISNSAEVGASNTATEATQGLGLVDITNNTDLDYSGNAVTAQGVVSDLHKFLQNGQVIYRVDISLSVGVSSTVVYYYCNYNVYNQLSVGDVLNVNYQQVSDSCFSVNFISQ